MEEFARLLGVLEEKDKSEKKGWELPGMEEGRFLRLVANTKLSPLKMALVFRLRLFGAAPTHFINLHFPKFVLLEVVNYKTNNILYSYILITFILTSIAKHMHVQTQLNRLINNTSTKITSFLYYYCIIFFFKLKTTLT